MKTIALKLAILFLLFANQVFAKILTVANQTTPQVAQYNSIQAAHNAALNGDTIYVYPSIISYKGAVITKKINIIGAGFNIVTDNSDCSKIISTDSLKFETGSEWSTITSMTGSFITTVNTNNISINKCKLNRIFVHKNITNVSVVNSIIRSSENYAIYISENSFLTILNNIIESGSSGSIQIGNNANGLIKNNVIINYGWPIIGYSASLYNNILLTTTSGYYFSTDALITNTSIINYYSNDKYSWFIDYQKQDYHLKTGSPGTGAGKNSIGLPTDLGIYGGDYPFIDDGAPSLPTIYYMNIPAIGNQKYGLSVQVKAKTNK